MELCIADICRLLLSKRFKLNDHKTELLITGTRQQLEKVNFEEFCGQLFKETIFCGQELRLRVFFIDVRVFGKYNWKLVIVVQVCSSQSTSYWENALVIQKGIKLVQGTALINLQVFFGSYFGRG